ncbi:unnamed protein product [Protopolystoma xenopodis]|uniref:Uncharacterized protein n=1 Tax=Protopolystoma xenopodis TaxID=117903 RepID=A0A3S5B6A8_9PLAT|nr:unnamed protein product [Protopolystoma xenopodis]
MVNVWGFRVIQAGDDTCQPLNTASGSRQVLFCPLTPALSSTEVGLALSVRLQLAMRIRWPTSRACASTQHGMTWHGMFCKASGQAVGSCRPGNQVGQSNLRPVATWQQLRWPAWMRPAGG